MKTKAKLTPCWVLASIVLSLLLTTLVSLVLFLKTEFEARAEEMMKEQTKLIGSSRKERFWWPASGKYRILSTTDIPGSVSPFRKYYLWVADSSSTIYPIVIESNAGDYTKDQMVLVTFKKDGGTNVESVE